MALFDRERIPRRMQSDSELFSDAFISLSEVVGGRQLTALFSSGRQETSQYALKAILEYFGVRKEILIPAGVTDPEEKLDHVFQPEGIMRRFVRLEKDWYRSCFAPMLGFLENGSPVALIPRAHGFYRVDQQSGERIRITAENAGEILPEAICFYCPLPQRRLTVPDLLKYAFRRLTAADRFRIILITLGATLFSLVLPAAQQYAFRDLVVQSSLVPVFATLALMICSILARAILNAVRSVSLSVIGTKADTMLGSAIMMRVLSMPVSFFRDQPAGDLYARINDASGLCSVIQNFLLSGCLTAGLSLVYLLQISAFAPALVVPSFCVTAILLAYSMLVIHVQAKVNIREMEASANESGFLFSMLGGMQKIRLAGAERRLFSQWAERYKPVAELNYRPPFVIRYNTVITTAITVLGTGILYFQAWKHRITVPSYMAFAASYGLLTGTLSSLSSACVGFSVARPVLKMIAPLLETAPETEGGRRTVGSLSGQIEISKISFRYRENSPDIIKDLSLTIRPGEYVAFVGKSGSGKSTLLRLLLGFEKLTQGSISYDGCDLSRADLRSLRKHIGCVLQNEHLFSGSIRANLTVSAPDATDEEIWEALRMAGMDEDVRGMPMGLNTMVSDGVGGISGGQKQRLIIARAILPKPDLLFFDEATSALDNYTQKTVADALASLKCTRVVIAHRLSTVRNCDRIILLENGTVAEEGTYEELMAANGRFADLVARQRL